MKKCVVVTGAYGGMGRATVNALKEKGYYVFALDKNVGAEEESVMPIEVDVTSEESVLLAMRKVSEKTDEIFAIIHFAGIYLLDSLVEIQSDRFEKIVKVNFFGAYYVNKAFLPLLKSGGRILLTTSELAPLKPLPFTGIYAVTKSALDKYAYSLKMELQLLGISVSVLRAGAVNTGMLGASTKELESFCEKTKLYECNAKRFKAIVNGVESKCVPPEKLAKKAVKIIEKKNPAFSYKINANPLLKLLSVLPEGLQFYIIRKILE